MINNNNNNNDGDDDISSSNSSTIISISTTALVRLMTKKSTSSLVTPITSFKDKRSFGKVVEHLYTLYMDVGRVQDYLRLLAQVSKKFGHNYCELYKNIEKNLEVAGCVGTSAGLRKRLDPSGSYCIYAKPDLIYSNFKLKEFKILNSNNTNQVLKSIIVSAILQCRIFSYVYYSMPTDLYIVTVDYNNNSNRNSNYYYYYNDKVKITKYLDIRYNNDIEFPSLAEVKEFLLCSDNKVRIDISDFLR